MMEALIGLGGVLVGASMAWIRESFSAWQNRKRNARYLAIRVVCQLDEYVADCIDVAYDEGVVIAADGEMQAKSEPPLPPVYPNDIDWKSIDSNLMYRALSLPSEAQITKRLVDSTFAQLMPVDHEFGFETRQLQYSRLGLFAYRITKDLRRIYNIPVRDTGLWDPERGLQINIKEIENARNERAKRNPSNVTFSQT